VFRYRRYTPDEDELGEATYAVMIKPGEEIIGEGTQWFRVVDVVPFDEEDESPFVGLLQGEPAWAHVRLRHHRLSHRGRRLGGGPDAERSRAHRVASAATAFLARAQEDDSPFVGLLRVEAA